MTGSEFNVCPNCGSRNVSGVRHMKPWLARFGPIMGIYTCEDCGYEGLPITLDSEENRQELLRHIRRQKGKVDK